MQRRYFLRQTTRAALGLSALGLYGCGESSNGQDASPLLSDSTIAPAPAPNDPRLSDDKWFEISLAQWSLNEMLRSGELDNLDFATFTREQFGIRGIEYVNTFFKDKARDQKYLRQLNHRAAESGVTQVLIMVDEEGNLGAPDKAERMQAVENHHQWVDAAKSLGCHSIRVNARGQGTREEVGKAATEGLAKLSEYGAEMDINVIVENHGGYSSDGGWLTEVIKNTGMDNCGTLPDFGNFCIERNDPKVWEAGCKVEYDRYKGVREMMPYAKAVSAKANAFDADGNVVETDYEKMLAIVKDAGYRGWIGIEFEGPEEEKVEGIKLTRDLLLRLR